MSRSVLAAAALVALLPATLISTPASPAPPDAVARSVVEGATYTVIARASRTNAVADDDVVRISGRVEPRAAGQTVVLQQRREDRKRWTRSGSATIKRTGSFVLRDYPSTAGVRYYRVLKPASDGRSAGVSAEMKVSVWAWRRLALGTPSSSDNIYYEDNPSIGTVPFPMSITQESPGVAGYAEYTLGRQCRSLRATYALTDTSLTGATGQVVVTVDGVVRAQHALATGTVVGDAYTDLSNAFRIRFDLTASASPAGWSAIGTPEVLCVR